MDIVILLVMLLLIALLCKRLDNTIIFIGLFDIFLRIVNFIGNNTIKELKTFTNKYFPISIPGIIKNYSSGILETILIWIYIFVMSLFVVYVFKILIKRTR